MTPIALARRAALWLATAATALVAACTGLPPANLQSPTVRLLEFGLADIGLSEVRFDVIVAADNPNDVAIPMSNVKVDLDLFGAAFATGRATQAQVSIPGKGTAEVPLQLVVPTTRLLDIIRVARTSGDWSKFSYRLKGTANWGESSAVVPFAREGNLDVIRKAMEVFGPLAPR